MVKSSTQLLAQRIRISAAVKGFKLPTAVQSSPNPHRPTAPTRSAGTVLGKIKRKTSIRPVRKTIKTLCGSWICEVKRRAERAGKSIFSCCSTNCSRTALPLRLACTRRKKTRSGSARVGPGAGVGVGVGARVGVWAGAWAVAGAGAGIGGS